MNTFSFEANTDVLGSYLNLESITEQKDLERIFGKYSRENQLVSAAANTNSLKAQKYLKEALSCQNTRLIDQLNLTKDEETGEIRAKELTSLMTACIMGNMKTV